MRFFHIKSIFFPVLVVTLFSFFSYHSINDLKSVFYDLPINKSRKEIISTLKKDHRFTEINIPDTATYISMLGESYSGVINKPNFPEICKGIDSAFIEITWGYSVSKKKNGHTTYLKLKYKFNNKMNADKAFDFYWYKIKNISKDTSEIGIGYRDKPGYLHGKQVYLKHKDRLRAVVVARNDDYENSPVIVIEYTRWGN